MFDTSGHFTRPFHASVYTVMTLEASTAPLPGASDGVRIWGREREGQRGKLRPKKLGRNMVQLILYKYILTMET